MSRLVKQKVTMIQTFFMLSWILMPAEGYGLREQAISYLSLLNTFLCGASLTESSIIVALLV